MVAELDTEVEVETPTCVGPFKGADSLVVVTPCAETPPETCPSVGFEDVAGKALTPSATLEDPR